MARMLSIIKKRLGGLEKTFAALMLLMNVLFLVFGIIYLYIGESTILWNLYGFIMLFSLLGNIKLSATDKIKKVLNFLYLILSSFFLPAVFLFNTMVSITPTNQTSQSTISAMLLFSLFILGGAIAVVSLLNKSRDGNSFTDETQTIPTGRIGIVIKNIIIILFSAVLYFGLFLAINLLRAHKNGLLEVFISEYALCLAISFLSVGVLIIKLLDRKKYFLYYTIILTTNIFIFVVFLLPIAAVPSLLKNAENNYSKAFGMTFEGNPNFSKEFFRQLPFSMPEYFYGTPSKKYQVQEDVLFYQGKEGIDKGLQLYFDVYSPIMDGSKLPGGNSILIRIHGGGWTSGDKGESNFAQMNKYFAAQGYIVFDIQYGLNDVISWINVTPVNETRLGNFSINDMVRHIGIFTNYLVDHNSEYQANLNSVFISGGSAGGQLTLASGLAMTNGGYRDILNPKIVIKGVIPFYPANGLSEVFDIGGREELVNPIAFVNEKSPPCLIYQGSHDGLVNHKISDRFRDAYLDKGNEKCAVITMPFGGHGSDLYFSGYYNQIFLYYMERFMYEYR